MASSVIRSQTLWLLQIMLVDIATSESWQLAGCFEGNGKNYTSQQTITASGKTCAKWSNPGLDIPADHKTKLMAALKAHDNRTDHNYCRNVLENLYQPWCYTESSVNSNAAAEAEVCQIPLCNLKCDTLPCNDGGCMPAGKSFVCVCLPNTLGPYCQFKEGQWAVWREWTRCVSCGIGRQYRNRTCAGVAASTKCQGASSEERECQGIECQNKANPAGCATTTLGNDYRGTVSATINGEECISWRSYGIGGWATDNATLQRFGDGQLDHNYCRNGAAEYQREKPWCFVRQGWNNTALLSTSWQYCSVEMCTNKERETGALECYKDTGQQYKGSVRRTQSGKACASWADTTLPIEPDIQDALVVAIAVLDGYAFHRSCRNPTGIPQTANRTRPWCVTDASANTLTLGWEYCDIPKCDKVCFTSRPCQNDGVCTQTETGTYKCTCATAFSGINCEKNFDECAAAKCQNGATCRDGVNKYTCICPSGYEGQHCETEINECGSQPCKNSARCIDQLGTFQCQCSGKWEGQYCDIAKVNECDSSPCLNGGTCKDGIGRYDCICEAPWSGQNCQDRVGFCASDPCQNGGTCKEDPVNNDFTCNCQSNYFGTNCEYSKLHVCYEMSCTGASLCVANTSALNTTATCGRPLPGGSCHLKEVVEAGRDYTGGNSQFVGGCEITCRVGAREAYGSNQELLTRSCCTTSKCNSAYTRPTPDPSQTTTAAATNNTGPRTGALGGGASTARLSPLTLVQALILTGTFYTRLSSGYI